MQNVKVCPKCAFIYSDPNMSVYKSGICYSCKISLIDINYSTDKYMESTVYTDLSNKETTAERGMKEHKLKQSINREIFYKFIEPLGTIDKNSKGYELTENCLLGLNKEKYETEIKELSKKIKQQQIEKEKSHIPTCPICSSTNLSKISTAKKVAKIGMFGIFGMGDNGKTYVCNNCKAKF